MANQRFYSDNDSGTFADALKAVGLAEVFRTWLLQLERGAAHIAIEDKGAYYQIDLPHPLDEAAVARVSSAFVSGLGKSLVSKKLEAKAASDGRRLEGFQYDLEREKANTYFAQLKKLAPADRKRFSANKNEIEELRALEPHPDLGLYVYVNHFKVADGYNALVEQWRGQSLEGFRAHLRLLLAAFSTHPNPVDAVAAEWEALAKAGVVAGKGSPTLLQLVNPASGKGGNATKASGLGIGNLDGFWLAEYLKFVGLFTVAAPFVVAGGKDRKTYVLRPVKVELGALELVMADFRRHLYATSAVKLDIMAALGFTRELVAYIQRALRAVSETNPLLALAGRRPRVTDIASGFDVAFYKDMGSAYATMNLATINLPGWLGPVETPSAADAMLALLREHELVIAGIKTTKGDEGADEIELLRRYRDFLSGHDAERFFDFAARYGDYYLAKRHRAQWAGQLTTNGMESLMAQSQGAQRFRPILENEGFRAIATAIRRATVSAQYAATRETNYPYEVRYGLGQELLRAANYSDNFLAALGAFIQSYNAENARIDERIAKKSVPDIPRNRRASVRTSHIDDLVGLIDDYQGNSDLICKMLVAYGYARDPRAQPEVPPRTQEDSSEVDDSGVL